MINGALAAVLLGTAGLVDLWSGPVTDFGRSFDPYSGASKATLSQGRAYRAERHSGLLRPDPWTGICAFVRTDYVPEYRRQIVFTVPLRTQGTGERYELAGTFTAPQSGTFDLECAESLSDLSEDYTAGDSKVYLEPDRGPIVSTLALGGGVAGLAGLVMAVYMLRRPRPK